MINYIDIDGDCFFGKELKKETLKLYFLFKIHLVKVFVVVVFLRIWHLSMFVNGLVFTWNTKKRKEKQKEKLTIDFFFYWKWRKKIDDEMSLVGFVMPFSNGQAKQFFYVSPKWEFKFAVNCLAN